MDAKAASRPFATAFRRWWWMIVVATIVAGIVGYVVASRERPVYEAEVRVLVGPINADADTQAAAGSLAATYTALVTSEPVLAATSEALGAANDDEYAWGPTGASANVTTRILTITVQSDDPELAARIANTLAENVANRVAAVAPSTETSQLLVIEPATPPPTPSHPLPARDGIFAALAGLCASIALAVVFEAMRTVGRRRKVVVDRPDTRAEAS